MDDQIDGRTLVGSYVCTERPGEFRWQPGSLTQAVQNGFWIVFEDIDKAPSDVHSILVPLLEGAGSFVTGHGEVNSLHSFIELRNCTSLLGCILNMLSSKSSSSCALLLLLLFYLYLFN
ncbi:putative P-loop containing nucleoside triphosphate hydrolase [Lupinus albus]|uniref:Putative P-loop containing nucleoside triphosphate hydrolase n=1 Tax=Lupinus albus TaxID=3870 RepID=A0A6A4NJQ6_LUPAL|nr:putative P-loop containing nucleoside triphosphate hydrolase [Lupinus albus]